MRSFLNALAIAAVAIIGQSCEHVDNHRLPPCNVQLNFPTIGDWEAYGLPGPGTQKEFIRENGIPVGYPYRAGEYTGFGGLLLVCDPNGEYRVFDLACPVERSQTVRISPYTDTDKAGLYICRKCQSVYDIYTHGSPIAGEAHKLKYGLEEYHLFVGNSSQPYAYARR